MACTKPYKVEKLDLGKDILRLKNAGHSLSNISRLLKLDRRTIRNWLKAVGGAASD